MKRTIALLPLLGILCGPARATTAPRHQLNPDVSLGGFSVTLANGDDATSEFVPHQCTLQSLAVGIVQVTATGADNFLDVPLEAMASSAGYRFDTGTYKILRLRVQAGANVTGGFELAWETLSAGQKEAGSVAVPHQSGSWAVHLLDFSAVPQWRGDLVRLRLRMLAAPSDVGRSVLIDRVELVADDSADTAFGLEPVLLSVIQRVKLPAGGYRSEWEDLAKYPAGKEKPANAQYLDGRLYYVAKDAGLNRVPVHRCVNQATGDYLEAVGPAPAGYVPDALLGYVWTRCYPGMSPVLRVVNQATGRHALANPTEKLAGYALDVILGYAYARNESPLQEYETKSDKMDHIFYISSGKVRFGVNLDHGAAGWHWFHGDKQMVNISDFGRQMQLSYYFNGLNPSEVGFGRGQVGNPVIHVHRLGNRLVTRTVPMDWNFRNITRIAGSISHPDLVPGITLGKDVTFGILGHSHLAKWTAYLHTPKAVGTTKGGSQLEIISNHPTADMVYRANVDFNANGRLILTATKASDNTKEKGVIYNYPKAGLGGNISALGPGDDQLAFGLMVGLYFRNQGEDQKIWEYTFAGERRLGSSRHVSISSTDGLGAGHGDPFDGHTTAQRSVMRSPTVAGDNRYIVYIMSGTVAEVKSYMQDLYDHRAQLEW